MKAIPSTLLTGVIASLWCFLVLHENAWARTSPDEPAAQTAQPQKRSFFSRFRKQPPPQAQQQQAQQQQARQQQARQQQARQQQARQQQARQQPTQQQHAQQQPAAEPEKRGFSLRLPKLRMPKVRLPGLKWPFSRGEKVSRQTVRDYPTGIPNPTLGGAYGIILEDQVKFFEIGPTQPFGPDEILSKGALVTIRSNDHAWAYITLQDGRSGYIGLDQVRMAAAREVRTSPSRPARLARIAENTIPSETYDPPALPTAAADLPDEGEPESNPLLDESREAAVADGERVRPVDSPEVLFDPLLDPLDPVPPASSGGPKPFLDDPIPSVEEELRAIREAKQAREAASSEDAEAVDDSSPDDGGA